MKLLATLVVPVAYVVMWLIEARWPARPYVHVRFWGILGASFFILIALTASLTPILWSQFGLTSVRVFDLSEIGWYGFPLGVLLTSGVGYAWHRAEHRFDVLWRMAHQLHHSALRVDVPGAFYTHPLEVVIKATLGILVGAVLLGLAPVVASAVSATLALLSIFQHWNIHTPRWLGRIIPRPEMHGLHHEYGIHGRNYGDLPIWDMLFGTYTNPDHFGGRVGFDPAESHRLKDMLLMRKVSES